MKITAKRPFYTVAATAVAAALLAGTFASTTARAAEPVGSVAGFAPEAGAVLTGEVISWQGEVLAARSSGYTAFSTAGVAATSPIASVGLRTSVIFAGQLVYLANPLVPGPRLVRASNPGGIVTQLGTVSATADALLSVGTQLWVARQGGIDRFSPTNVLGGATPIPSVFNAASTLRMTVGADGNVWVLERNAAAGGVDTISRWSPVTGAQVGPLLNFANSAADPSAIATAGDGSIWIILPGTNAVARFDQNLAVSELALPAGATPTALIVGPDGAIWMTETGLNTVSRLTFAAGTFKREPYSAPSSFGLQGLTVGPDGNIWAVGTVANRVARFGTTQPTTTTTVAPTTAAPTVAPTTVAPTTAAPTTAAPTTAVPTTVVLRPAKRVCIKSVKRRVKVKGKFVTQTICTKYR